MSSQRAGPTWVERVTVVPFQSGGGARDHCDYLLRWKVLAADGHVTEGVVPFQVGAEAIRK